MEPLSDSTNTIWSFPLTPQDWEQTLRAVQTYVRTMCDEVTQLHDRVETLEARLRQNSTTPHRPPSSDNPRVIQFSNLIPMRVNARSGWAAKRRHAAAMLV